MNEKDRQVMLHTLENANYLISEEYQSLLDEDLKRKYMSVLQELEIAIQLLK